MQFERESSGEGGTIGKGKSRRNALLDKGRVSKFIEQVKDKPVSYYAFQILYWCGLRMGELLALTPADIDIPKNVIHITKSYQRIKGKDVITDPKTPKSNSFIEQLYLRNQARMMAEEVVPHDIVRQFH